MAEEKASKININGQEYEVKDAQAREAVNEMQTDMTTVLPIINNLINANLDNIERINIDIYFAHSRTQVTRFSNVKAKVGDIFIGWYTITERSYTDRPVSFTWGTDKYDIGRISQYGIQQHESGVPNNSNGICMIEFRGKGTMQTEEGFIGASVGGPSTTPGGGPGVDAELNGWLIHGGYRDAEVINS